MYYFDQFSDDYYRVINQTGVHEAKPWMPGNENFNCCWDGDCAPDGTFYTTLSSESGKCDHAKLVRYDRDTNKLVLCFYAGDLVLPQERQLPHSKLHTSINFIPTGDKPEDYLVIATTHSTDRAKHHTEWMPFGHQNHVWEGFPGSQILVYDPITGHAESWGTPVPHESIYGAKYDPKHRRLYMIGFMRGHVYSFDIDTRRVTKDLGKAAEVFCFRLALGADGNIYGCTKSGFPFMIDTEENKLVDLGAEVPAYYSPEGNPRYVNNTWYRYLGQAENSADGKYLYMFHPYAYDLYRLEFATKKITSAGKLLPFKDGEQVTDLVRPQSAKSATGNNCMTMDKYGVLWYILQTRPYDTDEDVRYTPGQYLCRWDITHGGQPELLGMVGTPDYVHNRSTEMACDHIRDILYIVNVGHGFGENGPDVVRIDLPEFRPYMYEQGPVTTHSIFYPVRLTDEEIRKRAEARARKNTAGEENSENNPFQAFPIDRAYPVRIWREIGEKGELCDHIEDAKVIGMAFDEKDVLHVVTGAKGSFGEAAYVFRIQGHDILSREDFSAIDGEYREWLRANILPQPVAVDEGIRLPEATGRRYRAKASATAAWHDGRAIVGTMDALLAMVSADGKVYCLGGAAAYGPVRCMCTNAAKTKLWGVAGDEEDMGYIFTYDDDEGLRQLGILSYNSVGFYRPTESNVLSSIVLSHDERTLAVGSADRIATVHIITL
ncbi:MAG: hypothetical protein VB111_07875 [Clostridiaceae bacterium]|nr:hypothetical protein [Clostridiaceae bacterium]